MAIPFQELIQITITGDEELEEEGNKIVSLSLDQVLTKKVEYRLEA